MSQNKPQIVMFLAREIRTGGERFLTELLKHFRKRGIRTEPIYIEQRPRATRRLGLIVDCLASNLWFFKQVSRIPGVTDAILFEDFYLHPRLFLFNAITRSLIRQVRMVSLVQNLPLMHPALKSRIYRDIDNKIVNIFLRQVNMLFANSVSIKQSIAGFGVGPAKITVVYAGYDGEILPLSVSRARPTKTDAPQHILFVGQLTLYKGVEYLLRALSILPRGEQERTVVDIVGNVAAEPSYYRRLVKIVTQNSLQDRVIFHGHMSDRRKLRQLYELATMFVLPSLAEGFGIVLLEAMSAHLPIVATRVGGIPELVQDGMNGILVPPRDPAALANAIGIILSSPQIGRSYGENGYCFFSSRRDFYSWYAVGERVLQAIEPLLQEKV